MTLMPERPLYSKPGAAGGFWAADLSAPAKTENSGGRGAGAATGVMGAGVGLATGAGAETAGAAATGTKCSAGGVTGAGAAGVGDEAGADTFRTTGSGVGGGMIGAAAFGLIGTGIWMRGAGGGTSASWIIDGTTGAGCATSATIAFATTGTSRSGNETGAGAGSA